MTIESRVRDVLAAADVHVGGERPWDLTVHDDRFYFRLFRDGSLGLGESFQAGWWDAPSLDQTIACLLSSDARSRALPTTRAGFDSARRLVANVQNRPRAVDNAVAHYGAGNDLFEAMLDKRMIYSCAYWRDAHDLDAAQVNKLDLICQKLHLEPGMRLLDIGCGWGGFAHFAAERYGAQVTGISPVAAQVALATERTRDMSVEIFESDFRDVQGTFDRIVSVGMLEHVGAKNFQAFFHACDRLLAPDGIMLHHTIGSTVSKWTLDPWFERYVFPGGLIPSLSQLTAAAEPGWVLEDLHSFGPDYDRTLMAWAHNISTRWPELPRYDLRFQRTWRYYLQCAAASFRLRQLQLFQLVFRRSGAPDGVYIAVR